ncbi:MAG TPA: hypothetical protein VL201_01835 [Patescibacteria group bacterium]|jgi:hypothetical protein|nr:hypothetical protein [Patescibacteria group bacterium]
MIFKKNIDILLFCMHIFLCVTMHTTDARITSAFNQDIYPLFTTTEPRFLLDKVIAFYKEEDEQSYQALRDRIEIHVAPFGVTADRGRTIDGVLPIEIAKDDGFPSDIPQSKSAFVPLGDLQGRTNLIALLFGAEPAGQNLPPVLQTAKQVIFGPLLDANGNIDDGDFIDPQENFGCESIYYKYTKKGFRLSVDARFTQDFGGTLSLGVSSQKNTLQKIVDKTEHPDEGHYDFDPKVPDASDHSIKEEVDIYLAKEFYTILSELDRNLTDNSSRTSIDIVELSLFWRHVFELTPGYDEWMDILLVPYIECIGVISPGAKKRPHIVYEPVFGNNQHAAIGFATGLYIDFVETIYISTEFGYAHFFKHDFDNVPVPNSPYQANIYPFVTDISVRPGANWHFSFKMGCDQFVEKLSFYIEYVMMEHKKDSVELRVPDPAFFPAVLEQVSPFKAKLCNISISYAFSPNASVGFLWQVPISQRNAYRSTTVMLSLDAFL